MLAACQKHDVKLMIAYYRRTYPVVRKMKELLDAGAIGQPMLARINLTAYYDPENPRAPEQWRADPLAAGGGVLFDVGSHRLDVLVHLLGDAREVAGFSETLHARYQVEDAVALALRLTSGVHAVANFNWNIGSSTDEFEVYGTEGKLLARSLEGGHLEVYRGRELAETCELPPPKVTHWGLVENLVAAVNKDAPLICSGEEGMKTSQIMEAAYRAAREKRTVSVL
jgi:predicted dehydrogenase